MIMTWKLCKAVSCYRHDERLVGQGGGGAHSLVGYRAMPKNLTLAKLGSAHLVLCLSRLLLWLGSGGTFSSDHSHIIDGIKKKARFPGLWIVQDCPISVQDDLDGECIRADSDRVWFYSAEVE